MFVRNAVLIRAYLKGFGGASEARLYQAWVRRCDPVGLHRFAQNAGFLQGCPANFVGLHKRSVAGEIVNRELEQQ